MPSIVADVVSAPHTIGIALPARGRLISSMFPIQHAFCAMGCITPLTLSACRSLYANGRHPFGRRYDAIAMRRRYDGDACCRR